jgi:hypothetical protein
MNRRLLHLAALALPLLGLGGLWLSTERMSRQGTEWDVPVRGYDPRDLLQGHYVQFQYDWPGMAGADSAGLQPLYGQSLCLEGTAPQLSQTRPRDERAPCAQFVRSDDAWEGRLYASQDEALRLQKQLQDPALQGMIRIRLRPDGHVTPLRLTFRPRPGEPAAAPTTAN